MTSLPPKRQEMVVEPSGVSPPVFAFINHTHPL